LWCDAKFVEGVAECGGVWFGGCEDNPQHVVYFWGIFRRTDTHLLGGDDVHDVVSCHDVGEVGRKWAGGRHVLFPARSEGKKDEEAEVAEGVAVFVFFWTEECAGANSFDEEFEAFVDGVDVGCGDGEEFGDGGEVGDVAEGLIRAFKKVSQSGIKV
jgi:hypothetical protein